MTLINGKLTKITRRFVRNGKHRSVRGAYVVKDGNRVFVRAGDMVGKMIEARADDLCPERKLLIGVITQAANDYLSPDHYVGDKEESDACHFLFVDPYLYELSSEIGIDGDYVRRLVDEMDGGIVE